MYTLKETYRISMSVCIPCTHDFKFDLKTKIQLQDKPSLEFKEIDCKTFMRQLREHDQLLESNF